MQRRRVPPPAPLFLSPRTAGECSSSLVPSAAPISCNIPLRPPLSSLRNLSCISAIPLFPPSSDLLLETIPRPLSTAALSQQERARKICPVKKMIFFTVRNCLSFFPGLPTDDGGKAANVEPAFKAPLDHKEWEHLPSYKTPALCLT